MSYQSEVLADSPAVYWRLQETNPTTTTTLADSSGHGVTGTVQASGASSVAGPFTGENAIKLPGGSGSDIEDSNGYNPGGGLNLDVCSFDCWFKRPDTTTQQGIGGLTPWVSGGHSAVLMMTASGALQLWSYNSNNMLVQSTSSITDTGWHHVAFTKNGSSVHLYLDSVDVTGTVTNVTMSTSTGVDFVVGDAFKGSPTADVYSNATFAEAAAYLSALSATRIQAHYNAVGASAAGDLVGAVGV